MSPAGSTSPAVELEVGDRTVRLSNPDRVYFPATGATKLDLARYYLAVGDGIVRALRERPCMMHRFPEGLSGDTPSWNRWRGLPFRVFDSESVDGRLENILDFFEPFRATVPMLWSSDAEIAFFDVHFSFVFPPDSTSMSFAEIVHDGFFVVGGVYGGNYGEHFVYF